MIQPNKKSTQVTDNVSVDKETTQNNITNKMSTTIRAAKRKPVKTTGFTSAVAWVLQNKVFCFVAVLVLLLLIVVLIACGVQPVSNSDETDVGVTETTMESTSIETETAVTMSDEEFFDYLLNGTNGTEVEANTEIESIFYQFDRETLFTANENAVGVINIANTDVEYTVVQADDNAYYLDKDEFGNASESGAIYGDYRNDFNQLDRNNVLYGHNMASGKMFGTLRKMLDETFYADGTQYIQFNSKYYNNVFAVYSVYEIDLTTFNYIQTGFADKDEFTSFVARTQELNDVQALNGMKVPSDTHIITLSTCIAGGEKRLVVHGYLYAREVA